MRNVVTRSCILLTKHVQGAQAHIAASFAGCMQDLFHPSHTAADIGDKSVDPLGFNMVLRRQPIKDLEVMLPHNVRPLLLTYSQVFNFISISYVALRELLANQIPLLTFCLLKVEGLKYNTGKI